VVAAFQSGRFFDGGASSIGFATSLDGGLTWTDGFLPGLTVHSTPPGPYDRASDPTVAYDAKHDVWLISALALIETPGGLLGEAVVVSRSTDGGLTWSLPVVVSEATGANDYDKNWTACDNRSRSPHFGKCYTTWDDFGMGNLLLVSTSSDGGLTWGPKTSPSGAASGLGGIPVSQPNGTVIIPASNAFGSQIIAFRSTNGGQTFGPVTVVTPITSHNTAGNLRASNFLPSVDVDATGRVYVVWSDCRFRPGCTTNDLVMTTSVDGVSWTPVVRIPIDPVNSTVDHFIPGLAVQPGTSGATARLGLAYYFYPNANCTASTCELLAGFVSSTNGGASWTAPQTLAGPMKLSWIANTSQGRMVGDYISTSFVGTTAVPVFADANPPSRGKFDEATFATTIEVTAAETSTASVDPNEPVVSVESDHELPSQELRIR
jgi:hypothetical protein